ncbi:MAG: hypothetical protein AAFQ57_08735 [Cyanobacteria bacterium J06626_14]
MMNVFQSFGGRVSLLAMSAFSVMSVVQVNAAVSHPRPVSANVEVPSLIDADYLAPKISSTTSSIESGVPFQIDEGAGGAFTYEIWQTLRGSEFYLFIWDDAHSETDEPTASYNFRSATEALNFFTCRYARVRIASCNLLISSVSYDIPDTCAFPWAPCTELYREPASY